MTLRVSLNLGYINRETLTKRGEELVLADEKEEEDWKEK